MMQKPEETTPPDPQNSTPEQQGFSRTSWLTASATMWAIGIFVAIVLVISAGIAIIGPSRIFNNATTAATPTPAAISTDNYDEPPIPVVENPIGRAPVPTYLDATRACNATAQQDPKTIDPITRARCAVPTSNSDMYVIRVLLDAAGRGSVSDAQKAFTARTDPAYVADVIRNNYIFQNMNQIYWSGSIFQPYMSNGNIIEFETFYGAIAYNDGSYRRFTAAFQKQNGQWKLRTMEFESLS